MTTVPEVYTVYSSATGTELYTGTWRGLIWTLRHHAHNLRRLGVMSQDEYMDVLHTGLNPLRDGGSFSTQYEQLMQLTVIREDLF